MPTKLMFRSLVLSCAMSAVFSLSAICQSATSQAPAPAASKIGFVNIQEAVVTCNEGKKETTAMEQKFAAQQNALKAQDEELKKLKQDFQAVNQKLSDAERNSRARTIDTKQKALQRAADDYQNEVQQSQQEAMARIYKKMEPVLQKY